MNRPKISREELVFAAANGRSTTDVANSLEVTRRSVCDACSKYGIRLYRGSSRSPLQALKVANENLPLTEALENAYFLIGEITGQDDGTSCVWPHFDLTGQQRAIAQLLYANEGRSVTQELLMSALYLHDQDRADFSVIRVQLCQLRKKLKGTGFHIQTIRGFGFRLHRTPGTVFPWEARASP